jgi:hypothetical protein
MSNVILPLSRLDVFLQDPFYKIDDWFSQRNVNVPGNSDASKTIPTCSTGNLITLQAVALSQCRLTETILKIIFPSPLRFIWVGHLKQCI